MQQPKVKVTVIDHRCKDFFEYTAVGDKVNIEYENGTIIKGEVYDATETILKVKTQMFMRTIYLSDLQHQGFLIKVLHEVDTADTADEKPLEVVYVSGKTTVLSGGGKTVVEPIKTLPEGSAEAAGIKFDSNKLQWWYMWQFLPELEQIASVLQYGDTKYPAEDGSNWKRLPQLERRASSAAMRHLSAYLKGDKLDDETENSHLAHCITNLLFLMYNDRIKNDSKRN